MKNIITLYLVVLLSCQICFAQWSTNPDENTRISGQALLPQMISDDAGGAYITYYDVPLIQRQLFLQRIDRFGYLKFPFEGINVSGLNHYIAEALLIPDNRNGILIGYDDYYSTEDDSSYFSSYSFPYLQRIDSTGNKLWGEMGVRISSDTLSFIESMCTDGEGGCYLIYNKRLYNEKGLKYRFQLQHVNADGEFLFGAEGIKLNEKNYSDSKPVMIYDGHEGFLFTMVSYVDSTKKSSIFLYYFNKYGQEIWRSHLPTPLGHAKIILSNEQIFITGFLVGNDISTHTYIYQLCS